MVRKHPMKPPAIQERNNRIRALVDEGRTPVEIAHVLGVSRQRVDQLLGKMGLRAVSRSEQTRQTSMLRAHEILRRYDERGQDIKTIAREMGCTPAHVRAVIRPRHRLYVRMVGLVAEGKTAQEIQSILGYSAASSVLIYLRAHGLKAQTPMDVIRAKNEQRRVTIRTLSTQGCTPAEIRAVLGVSLNYVHRIINEAGNARLGESSNPR